MVLSLLLPSCCWQFCSRPANKELITLGAIDKGNFIDKPDKYDIRLEHFLGDDAILKSQGGEGLKGTTVGIVNRHPIVGKGTMMVEDGVEIYQLGLSFDFVVDNGGLLGGFIFEDERFYNFICAFRPINHYF